MIQTLCTVIGAFVVIAILAAFVLGCVMFGIALWNGLRADQAQADLDAELHELDRWLTEFSECALLIAHLRKWNRTRQGDISGLRDEIEASRGRR